MIQVVLPRWATQSHPEDAADDARIRGITPDERLEELVQIIALMETILHNRPDRDAELARREALPRIAATSGG